MYMCVYLKKFEFIIIYLSSINHQFVNQYQLYY